jgi:hypothetical protein
MGRVMRAKAMSPFVGQKMTNYLARPRADDLHVLKELIEAGKVKARDRRHVSAERRGGRDARARTGHGRGKVVITV